MVVPWDFSKGEYGVWLTRHHKWLAVISSQIDHIALFALCQVQLDSVLLKFQTLHHFYFVLCKLLREAVTSTPTLPGKSDEQNMLKFSSQGGFLRQPLFDSVPKNVDVHLASVDLSAWEEFSHILAGITWPSILKCLEEGKAYIDCKIYQVSRTNSGMSFPFLLNRT